MTLHDEHLPLVRQLLEDLKTMNALAVAADSVVLREKTRVKRYCARKNYSEASMRDKLKNDYDFQDALELYRYRLGEVTRLSATLRGVVAAVSLLDRQDV